MKKKWYAVRKGRTSNIIVTSWKECSLLVTGFSGARFKSFEIESEANDFLVQTSHRKTRKEKKPLKVKKLRKEWGECLERKSYTDLITGMFYRDRCVKKLIGMTIGSNYHPTKDAPF